MLVAFRQAIRYIARMSGDLELIFRPEVQPILDHFCALSDIRIAFYSPDGAELRVGESRANCRYCQVLRSCLGYENVCQSLDSARREEAQKLTDDLLVYECHGGMTEATVPVRICERLLGFVMIGQFRTRRTLPQDITAVARAAGREQELQGLFRQTPFFGPDKTVHVLGLFKVLVQFITERHMIQLREILGPVLTRLRAKPEEHLSLTDAAGLVGRSPTSLSRLFAETLGKSFRQVRTELMLEKADEFFRTTPGIQVKDVAFRLGFEDPLYFSRIYRKNRGVAPKSRKESGKSMI